VVYLPKCSVGKKCHIILVLTVFSLFYSSDPFISVAYCISSLPPSFFEILLSLLLCPISTLISTHILPNNVPDSWCLPLCLGKTEMSKCILVVWFPVFRSRELQFWSNSWVRKAGWSLAMPSMCSLRTSHIGISWELAKNEESDFTLDLLNYNLLVYILTKYQKHWTGSLVHRIIF
jgi:hypothetical protein